MMIGIVDHDRNSNKDIRSNYSDDGNNSSDPTPGGLRSPHSRAPVSTPQGLSGTDDQL